MARKKGDGLLLLGAVGLVIYAISKIGVVILVIAAVFGLIYLLYKLVAPLTSDTNRKADTTEVGCDVVAPERSTELSSQIQRIDTDAETVQGIIRRYRVESIPYPFVYSDPLRKKMESYQCIEVIQSVNRVIIQREECIKKLNTIKEEIDSILSCPGCRENKDRAEYLESNKLFLGEKLDEYHELKNQLRSKKVTLLDRHSSAFMNVMKACDCVKRSSKINNQTGSDFNSFMRMRSSLPDDLFNIHTQPIELNFGVYRFFLLPDVILAYDKQDRFISAFEPMSLTIRCKELEKSVHLSRSNGGWKFDSDIIADDSVKVSEGETKTTWLHERKSGGPDMRYSYNPMLQYRTDVYRHGEITIRIGSYSAEYSFSAGNKSKAIQQLVLGYTSIVHKPSAVPSLLRLLEATSKKTDQAHRLNGSFEAADKNTFCRVG